MSYKLSQLAPFPRLKNVELGKTIGHGGFGIVKAATYKTEKASKVIAVKFINLQMASQQKVTAEQIVKEAMIHQACKHNNIIELMSFNVDNDWAWMAMELGNNGDLFDKIEPDLGVDEEVAHFYFRQLINAVSFIHEKGVAHRDIKPENLVLDRRGNLKLTDFGLACVFKKKVGPKRMASTPCGSPPYIAPEISNKQYDPVAADIWSCGIVLFVLLTGKIAWEMPHSEDELYAQYIKSDCKVSDGRWGKIPDFPLSVLRKILNPDPVARISIENLKAINWVRKQNTMQDSKGMCSQPLILTAKLLVNLNVPLTDSAYEEVSKQSNTQREFKEKNTGTQPINYLMDDVNETNDYEKNYIPVGRFAASQEDYTEHSKRRKLKNESSEDKQILSLISRDPAFIQFSSSKPIDERIQQLQKHQAKYPELFAENFTRFFSVVSLDQLLITILEALHKIGFRSSSELESYESKIEDLVNVGKLEGAINVPLTGRDSSNMPVVGNIKVTKLGDNMTIKKVEFLKTKSDPLEWRRIFKKVAILCRDVVYVDSN